MLTECDERYLSQGSMQKLICMLGAKCFCNDFVKNMTYPPAEPAREKLKQAVDLIDDAYRILTDGVDQKQIERLSRFCKSNRLALVPEYSPVLQKTPMVMEWEHVRTMVDVLNSEVCTLCDKDRDGVRECKLRKAVYEMGGEPDHDKAKINEWCEISRGIL